MPTLWNKSSKRAAQSHTAVPLAARAVPTPKLGHDFDNFDGVASPLSSAAMLDIFAKDLHIFVFIQLQIIF